jgi:hypothetical protein
VTERPLKKLSALGAVLGLVALLAAGAFGLYEALVPKSARAATVLVGTTDSLEVVTSSASAIDYVVSYVDYTSSTATPGAAAGSITTATTTTFVPAPGAAAQRQLKHVSFRNRGTTSNTLTFQKDVSGTNYEMFSVTLGPKESLVIDSEGERRVYGGDGLEKQPATTVVDGLALAFLKVGAATEAAGLWQLMNKDSGTPGAWVPGTPGVNGVAVACNTTAGASTAGAPYLPNPAAGNYYITSATAGTSVVSMPALFDLIWFNTGLSVTTTTPQSITMPTLPARDINGSTNGDGWYAAILVTTATTNGSAVTNTTMSYTDSDGNAGNTATMASFPATAVAGAFIPFQLEPGDRGVRSIESITLGTSYGGGAISLVLYRPIVYVPSPVANIGGTISVVNAAPAGAKLWNGTCLNLGYLASSTTANTVNLNAQLTVR